jgi:hypothetical protein
VQLLALEPPFEPVQTQPTVLPLAGKSGLAGLAVPAEHNVTLPKKVAVAAYVLAAVPQAPFIGAVTAVMLKYPSDTSCIEPSPDKARICILNILFPTGRCGYIGIVQ